MRRLVFLFFICTIIISVTGPVLVSCSEKVEMHDTPLNRIIDFSGMKWVVRNQVGNPGGNYWSDSPESVWVDEKGALHLKIRYIDGKWHCSEIYTEPLTGYGEYRFYLTGDLENIDKNMVVGLFVYQDDKNEIDIEFSKWGNQLQQKNGNYVTQPGSANGNAKTFYISSGRNETTHSFIWKPNSIEFKSWMGHEKETRDLSVIDSWIYTGSNIPKPGNEKLMINLWLFRGIAPDNGKELEIVVNAVEVKSF